jgi:plasmid stability protein
MRTTLDIPDEVYRRLKVKAAVEGETLREIALRGILREIESVEGNPIRKLQLPVISSSRPGTLNLTNEQIDELTAFS